MADNNGTPLPAGAPYNRGEQLTMWLGGEAELPPGAPYNRDEQLIMWLGDEAELPPGAPYNRDEQLTMWLKDHIGGGGGATVEPLSVTANGEYTAPTGKAYSPVTVAVSKGPAMIAQVTIAGGNAYSISVTLPKAMSNFFFTVDADAETQAAIYGDSSKYYYVVNAIFQFPISTKSDGSSSASEWYVLRYRPSNHSFGRYYLNAVSLIGNTLNLELDLTTSFIGGGTYIVKVWEVDVQ